RSGLDYDSTTYTFSMEREQGFRDGFGDEYQANGLIAAKLAPRLGVVGSVQYRTTNRNNYDMGHVGTVPYVLPAGITNSLNIPSSMSFPFDAEFGDRLLTGGNYTQRDLDEDNLTASLNFAWEIGESTRLRLDLQRIQRKGS